jgi:hypothetical protein
MNLIANSPLEADVFMAEREPSDIARNELVSSNYPQVTVPLITNI